MSHLQQAKEIFVREQDGYVIDESIENAQFVSTIILDSFTTIDSESNGAAIEPAVALDWLRALHALNGIRRDLERFRAQHEGRIAKELIEARSARSKSEGAEA